ncbi:MAG: hypothetical protein Q8O25_14140, partial [Sulfurisoma sp.]|nr:hypothetical protein [Sulfurisoma sp.]
SIRIPEGTYEVINNRASLLAINVEVSNTTFFPFYFGHVIVLLTNYGQHDLPIMTGDKIATLVLLPMDQPLVRIYDLNNAIEADDDDE